MPDSSTLPHFYEDLLSETEKLKASNYKFAKDRKMFVFSHAVLRMLLARYLKQKPENLRFQYGPFGKPFLSKYESLQFNLSHSGNMALIALAQADEIGIDIEKTELKKDILKVSKTVYSRGEINALEAINSNADKVRYFYELWTRKEAYIKQLGFGLSIPVSLTDISVLSENVEIINASKEEQQNYGGRHIQSFVPHADYQAAVAWASPLIDLMFFDWE